MMKLAIVIPTVDGREDQLELCMQRYHETAPCEVCFFLEKNAGSCGVAWQDGASIARAWRPDYLFFTVDDFLPDDTWPAALEVADAGSIPAPKVRERDGTVHVWGGRDVAVGTIAGEDPAECAAVPLCTAAQWAAIEPMIPTHYATDWWFGHRARVAGFPIVACESSFLHLDGQPGRENAQQRLEEDVASFARYLSGDLTP